MSGGRGGVPIVIFASGLGSGFRALADAVAVGKLRADIRGLFCDKPGAPVLALARERGIPTVCLTREKGESREAYESRVLAAIEPWSPRWIVLSGFMRLLGQTFLARFAEGGSGPGEGRYYRVVNIHPSLLPSFTALDGYGQAFRHGVKLAGATVHLVDESLDGGPICAQEAFSIERCGTADEVASLGKEVEHRLYPETLGWLLDGRFTLERRGGSSDGRSFVRTY